MEIEITNVHEISAIEIDCKGDFLYRLIDGEWFVRVGGEWLIVAAQSKIDQLCNAKKAYNEKLLEELNDSVPVVW